MKLLNVKWSLKRTVIALGVAVGIYVIYVQGSAQRGTESGGDAEPASSTPQCQVESTVDGLNVRSAPEIDPANIVDQLSQGEQSDADTEVRNGFRKLAEGRWVSTEYLQPSEGC
ncbi:SH3 domain-containing protein [Actinophytocola gossypii]|uniref:SH3 domain-containing protein n=1 Tax=Actinophytocola gossypii TaxID=2812003 RepID=A0ABT2JE14_9PSEU|nr:SH3 domain-containing protein [Actinophytocola gossypii]MCT2586112.1 SH3 domain-containing protein [Actinophytocola gossypii]